jgi:hypothetical protein
LFWQSAWAVAAVAVVVRKVMSMVRHQRVHREAPPVTEAPMAAARVALAVQAEQAEQAALPMAGRVEPEAQAVALAAPVVVQAAVERGAAG